MAEKPVGSVIPPLGWSAEAFGVSVFSCSAAFSLVESFEQLAKKASEMIAKKMIEGKAKVISKDEMLKVIRNRRVDGTIELLITAGAGDIDALVDPLKEILEKP